MGMVSGMGMWPKMKYTCILHPRVQAAAAKGAAISKRFNHLENKKIQKIPGLSISSQAKKLEKSRVRKLIDS